MKQGLEVIFDRYAIFQTTGSKKLGGSKKQYQAIEGKTVSLDKLPYEVGAEVTFDEVLLRKESPEKIQIGQPFLDTPVKAIVLKHSKGPKVIAFKFKRRTKGRRKIGHRQEMTIVRIEKI